MRANILWRKRWSAVFAVRMDRATAEKTALLKLPYRSMMLRAKKWKAWWSSVHRPEISVKTVMIWTGKYWSFRLEWGLPFFWLHTIFPRCWQSRLKRLPNLWARCRRAFWMLISPYRTTLRHSSLQRPTIRCLPAWKLSMIPGRSLSPTCHTSWKHRSHRWKYLQILFWHSRMHRWSFIRSLWRISQKRSIVRIRSSRIFCRLWRWIKRQQICILKIKISMNCWSWSSRDWHRSRTSRISTLCWRVSARSMPKWMRRSWRLPCPIWSKMRSNTTKRADGCMFRLM